MCGFTGRGGGIGRFPEIPEVQGLRGGGTRIRVYGGNDEDDDSRGLEGGGRAPS